MASAEVFLHDRAARQVLSAALRMPGELAMPLIEYIALFRPRERGLSWNRVAKLLGELAEQIKEARVNHAGRSLVAPLEYWRDGINAVIDARDKGTLDLPLKNHSYLYTIVGRRADSTAAAAEKARDKHTTQQRRPPVENAMSESERAQAVNAAEELIKIRHALGLAGLRTKSSTDEVPADES